MLDTVYKDARERMRKSVDAVAREFLAVRTGKASPHLLDTVKVETYGSVMPLNQLATISVPDPRMLSLQVFDKSTVGDIVKAIQTADIGLNPIVDGQTVRLPVPAPNEDRRRELVKHCKHLSEEGRVAIRNVRRDANERVKNLQKEKNISEDQEADGHDEIQKLTDENIKKIDDMMNEKEKEVMEV